ncbi:MAG: 2-nitropropane dioxygenase [Parcubacteria group bacterium Athens0714_26]|nr:MAG: 2-nitropropane dioxygenase [Parcubacteria group bacterium Athens0714_26]
MEKQNTVLPSLKIGNKIVPVPIVLGPMGAGVSLAELVASVANEGGAGILSVVCIRKIWSDRLNRAVSTYEAVGLEIQKTRELSPNGVIGMNVMVAVQRDYQDSIRSAIDNKIDFITIGAGLIGDLPVMDYPHETFIAVIVSSARALSIIIEKWKRNKWAEQGYKLAAAIFEGDKAGGHLGFKADQIGKPEYSMEALLPEIKKVAQANGNFPVIAAGGIFTNQDILDVIALGADGVQMATRFMATKESSASDAYKQAVIETNSPDDIIVSSGSPCGLLFRVLANSPMYKTHLLAGRPPLCDKGFLLRRDANGKYTICPAKNNNKDFFCICNGLGASCGHNIGEEDLYTGGANAYRITRIETVKEVMNELKGLV